MTIVDDVLSTATVPATRDDIQGVLDVYDDYGLPRSVSEERLRAQFQCRSPEPGMHGRRGH